MKDIQNVVNSYLLNHEKQKKYLAVVLALSMLVTFIVPLILTQSAESMTRNNGILATQLAMAVPEGHEYLTNYAGIDANEVNGVTYSPKELSEVTLLIGEEINGSDMLAWAEGCTSAEEVIEAAKAEYFLGIANDFCVFLEGDFTPTQADAEGRVAVGGDIQFTGTWNYQIGSGDYANMEALIQRDKYLKLRNFAHAIVGGAVFRVHTLSTGKGSIYDTLIKPNLNGSPEWHTANKGNDYSYTAFYSPELDLYKKLVVGEPEISTHYDKNTDTDVWYNASCSHDYPGDCCSGEDAQHSYLENVNELAQMYKGELINFSEVFDWLRNQSQKLSRIEATGEVIPNGSEIILRAPENSKAEVIYFNLDSWNGITSIKYEHIPEVADGNNGYANVVVNCGSEMINIAGDNNRVFSTFNGERISNNGDVGSTDDEKMKENNKPLSENILFNFYEAKQIDLNANFNGTILAPDAKVVSEESTCKGHLSGALIAQSFRGGMEFGYRPYRGPSEILGTDSGYTISLDKFAPGNSYLSGATFEVTDNSNEVVQSWVTSGKRDYITLPTKIDFSGKTDYAASDAVLSHTSIYTIKETNAPEGFIKDEDTVYTVEITETVDNKFLFLNSTSASGGTFPRDVKTVVTLKNGQETLHTWMIEIFDIYEKAGLSSRRLTITEDSDDPQMFYLNNTDADFTAIDLAAYVTSTDDASTSMSSYTYKDTSTFETSTEVDKETVVSSVVTSSKNTVVNQTDENGSILTEPGVVVTNKEYVVVTETDDTTDTYGSTASAATTRTETTYVTVTDENQNPVTEPNVTCTTEITTYWTVTEWSTSYSALTSVNENNEPVDENGSVVGEGESAATYTVETNVTVAVTGTSVSMFTTVSHYIDSVLSDYNTECVVYPTATIPDFDTSTEKVQPPVFTLGEEKYYYDKNSNMIMPLPDENKTPKFVNSYGLIFRKVDQNGKDLLGADIKLTLSTANDNLEIWSWHPETDCEKLIDLSDLTDGTVYVFREETPPAGFEDAPDIYFKVDTANAKVYYGASADSLTNEIDLTTEHILEMTDVAMHGAKVKLTKVGTNAKDGVYPKLANAEFKLFTSDGVLVYPIGTESGTFVTGEDGTIDLYETFKAAGPGICNPTYIKEGYLLEGSYYLQEVNAPSLYETPTDFFYFNVEKADEGGFEITTGKTGYAITNNGKSLRITSDTLNSITEEMITSDKSFIKVTLYTSDATHVNDRYGNAQFAGVANGVAYEQNQNSYMPSGIQNNQWSQWQWFHIEGEYMTFTLKLSDVCKIMGVEQTLEGFKKITEFGVNTQGSTVVHEVELFPVYVPETYTITSIIWGDPCSTLVVDELTFYYLNGTTKTAPTPVTWTDENDYWHPFVIDGSMTKEGIVGIKLKVSGTGDSRIFIKAGDNIFGTGDSTRCTPRDEPYYFGETSGTDYTNLPKDEPTTPETSTTPTFSASGSDITVPNDLLGQEVDLRVLKKWSGDTGFEEMRPDNIQLQLYQATEPGLTQDQLTDAMKYGEPVTVTGSSWQYMWKDLPRIIPDDDQSNGTGTETTAEGDATEAVEDTTEETTEPRTYYYYVKEISGNSTDSYIVTYDNNGTNNGGTIGVTNSLISIDVEAVKIWVNYGETLPQSIRLQLQWRKDNDENFVDVEGREVEITSANQWSYEFTNLPSGATYRVREVTVPAGWTASNNGFSNPTNQDGGKLNITNTLDAGSLMLKKLWRGDSEGNRPQKVRLQLYRAKVIDPKTDYARLLQYSLYFYDANMCGTQAAENSLISWRDDCHVSDATNGVDGGYHDAGDHVMFGLPQGYTASTLGWSYYEFGDAYDELGQTEHYKTIMEHFCDFFVASTQLNADGSINRLLWQKGNGDQDHEYWGRPEDQKDGSRDSDDMYWINSSDTYGGDIAAEYAASLALAYLNFYDPDMPQEEKTKYEGYLETAKKLYAFAQSHTSPAQISFYNSSGTDDDRAMAAGWLYLATVKEGTPVEEYKNFNAANSDPSNAQAYSWDSVILGAAAAKAHITGEWSAVSGKVKGFMKSDYWYPSWGSWGTARYNAAMQFVALAAAKNDPTNAAVLRNWAQGQMNYILGDNDWGTNGASVCLVTGFAPNSGQWAHHRGASGYDSHEEYQNSKNVGGIYSDDGHVLIGALLGGPAFTGHTDQKTQMSDCPELLAYHKYIDSIRDYCCNEVALDYNAGLVGAAIGLYDAFGTGELRSSIDTVEKVFTKKTTLTVASFSAAQLAATRLAKASGIKGVNVVGSDVKAKATTLYTDEHGTYIVVTSGQQAPSDMVDWYSIVGFKLETECGDSTHTAVIGGYGLDSAIRNVNKYYPITPAIIPNYTTLCSYESRNWGGDNVTTCEHISTGTMKVYVANTPTMAITIKGVWQNVPSAVTKPSFSVNFIEKNWSYQKQVELNADNNWTVEFELPKNGKTYQLQSAAYLNSQDWNNNQASPMSANATSGICDEDATITITNTYTGSVPMETFTLTPDKATLEIGGTVKLEPKDAAEGDIGWESSNADVATVENGVVTALRNGEVTITATDSTGKKAYATITVNPIKISADETNPKIGETVTLSPTNYTGALTYTVKYADNTTETLEGNTFAPKKSGTVKITATDGTNVSEEIEIAVQEMAISLTDASAICIGQSKTITVKTPGAAPITWEVDSASAGLATVSGDDAGASVTALKSGTNVTIRATDANNVQRTVTFEILAMGMDVKGSSYTAGDSIEVEITNKPVSGTVEYSTDNVNWTAVAAGSNTFSVTAPNAANVTIYVQHTESGSAVNQQVPIEAVGITGTLNLIAGQQTQLTVNKAGTYTWTSDKPEVAAVDQNGNVTALKAGEAKITAVSGAITAEATVNVTAFDITNKPASAMTVKDTLTLTHNSTGEFTWTSSNESILTVDQSGKVTAVGEGSAVITVTDKDTPSVFANVEIRSKYGALQVTPTQVTLHTGDSAALTPFPSDNVSYEVSNSAIAEMNDNTITALAEGTATITAKRTNSDGQEETVQINVTVVPALTITAPNGEDPAVLEIGGTVQLTANNVQGTAKWSIPAQYADILSVDRTTGLVKALSDGVAVVQVTDDTNGTPATYNVKVSLTAAKVTLPENAVEYKLIEIEANATGDWEKVVEELPKTDGNGGEYIYYVVEVMDNGDGLNGTGGAIYYPISYSANGVLLGDTQQTIEVTNKMSEEVASGTQMPSAGGEGTTWYYIAGAAMMLAGIAGYFVLKRKQESER